MRQPFFWASLYACVIAGTSFGSVKVSDFREKATDLAEKTQSALESPAFKELQQMFKEKRVAVRLLEKGAYTSKFVNAKDKKEYLLTAVPMVSHFEAAAPPLAVFIISNGEESRPGWLQAARDRRGKDTCALLSTGGKLIAHAQTIEMLKEPPLPLERGKAAIAIAKNPEGDDVILVLCRSPYAAKRKEEMECSAMIFFSGDLAWYRFASAGKEKAKPSK